MYVTKPNHDESTIASTDRKTCTFTTNGFLEKPNQSENKNKHLLDKVHQNKQFQMMIMCKSKWMTIFVNNLKSSS